MTILNTNTTNQVTPQEYFINNWYFYNTYNKTIGSQNEFDFIYR